ncbi:MAG: glycerophosphodiester phosphodiesterase, partial [Clostridia bacterium]|nr:glycerophosphodiester phosphodiesterase [Clostridia bacterium]
MRYVIPAVIAAAVVLLPFFLIFPGIAGKKKKAPFYGRNVAHRGLYEKDQSVPENSLAAFRAAAESGYGVELDVQLSSDGEVMVFHDDDLGRVCGVDRSVCSQSYEELKKLRLSGTDESIPLFSEVLGLINGRVPLIVELKNGKRNKELCRKTLDLLSGYNGDYCVESFNPMIVSWFRFHAPSVLRGQLAQPAAEYVKTGMAKHTAFILGNLLFDFLARPQFVAYRIGKKPPAVRFAEAAGAMKVAWTSHDESNEE